MRVEWSERVEWSGVSECGVEWSGVEWSGVEWSGQSGVECADRVEWLVQTEWGGDFFCYCSLSPT